MKLAMPVTYHNCMPIHQIVLYVFHSQLYTIVQEKISNFTFNNCGHDLRGNEKLKVEYCKSVQMHNTLFYKGLILFNALPECLRGIRTIVQFKTLLKEYWLNVISFFSCSLSIIICFLLGLVFSFLMELGTYIVGINIVIIMLIFIYWL